MPTTMHAGIRAHAPERDLVGPSCRSVCCLGLCARSVVRLALGAAKRKRDQQQRDRGRHRSQGKGRDVVVAWPAGGQHASFHQGLPDGARAACKSVVVHHPARCPRTRELVRRSRDSGAHERAKGGHCLAQRKGGRGGLARLQQAAQGSRGGIRIRGALNPAVRRAHLRCQLANQCLGGRLAHALGHAVKNLRASVMTQDACTGSLLATALAMPTRQRTRRNEHGGLCGRPAPPPLPPPRPRPAGPCQT